jgi:pimeloyl-ACP methyl ester carboxylesterase
MRLVLLISALTVTVAAAAAPIASAQVVRDPCPRAAKGAFCGHVDVPADRSDPGAGTIPIAFERYRHTGRGPVKSVIIYNFGGPGAGTTSMRDIARFQVRRLMKRRDLLLIDPRGRGRSNAIDCPGYQHDTGGDLLSAIGACADQLGANAVRYSTAENAHDFEAVRAALGYGKVDFVGVSYGGTDAAAYATRFGEHLRSLVLDAPDVELTADVFERVAPGPRFTVHRVGVLCRRSPLCGRSARKATGAVEALVRRVRREPVKGRALDADGKRHAVTIDPTYLLVNILDNPGDLFLTPAEIPAAAAALRRGDAAPLLRLGAEGAFPIPGDSGDPAEFSMGAFSATYCLDASWPWSPDASLAQRQEEWTRAVAATPDAPFAPFLAEEILLSVYSQAPFCLPWPQTGGRPPVEPGAPFPNVPTLVLGGDLDADFAEAAALYPDAELVSIKGAGHPSQALSPCANDLLTRFIRTRRPGDTRCASKSANNYPGVRAFRLRAGARRLRVARAAVDASLDALKRSFMSSGKGPGLRGGSFEASFGDSGLSTRLRGARWTEDVAVTGTLRWAFEDGALDADLRVDGPGRRDGSLHLEGGWLSPNASRSLRISGKLGGRRIAARVPSS